MTGERDGFGRYRQVVFAATQPWLEDLVLVLGSYDARIRSVTWAGEHGCTIEFVPDTRADSPATFDVTRIVAVLTEPQ